MVSPGVLFLGQFLQKYSEWLMPPREQHMFSEGAETIHPLFVVFDQTPERIKKGLRGAFLPMVVQNYRPALIDDSLELVDQD